MYVGRSTIKCFLVTHLLGEFSNRAIRVALSCSPSKYRRFRFFDGNRRSIIGCFLVAHLLGELSNRAIRVALSCSSSIWSTIMFQKVFRELYFKSIFDGFSIIYLRVSASLYCVEIHCVR